MPGREPLSAPTPAPESPGANPGSPSPLVGLILCGGESKRMGRDKGLILKDGLPWALHMGSKLNRLGVPVIYSINRTQRAAYEKIIQPDRLIIDAAELSGPLNGLFTTHRRYPAKDILMLACDMLDMDQSTLLHLIDTYRKESDFEFFAYRQQDQQSAASQLWFQPFGAIYRASGLSRLPPPQNGSMQTLLRSGRTKILFTPDSIAFNNYNTPQ